MMHNGMILALHRDRAFFSELQNHFEVRWFEDFDDLLQCKLDVPKLMVFALGGDRQALSNQICRIKEEFELADLPIFIFGPAEMDWMLEFYQLGIARYVTPPHSMDFIRFEVKGQLERVQDKLESAQQVAGMMEELTNQLIHSERLATLGTMSASIAHEVNNPTAFISSNLQTLERFWTVVEPILRKECDLQPDHPQLPFVLKETPVMVERMKEGVRRIAKIVKNLKSFSHWKLGESVEVDIPSCIEQAQLMLSSLNERQIQIELFIPESTPKVMGDMQQLTQVFTNIMGNAIDAMEAKKADPKMDVSISIKHNWLDLTFDDNGTGIAPELQGKIWDNYFTTKDSSKGTGLGLNICKKIIEFHGGAIELTNLPQGGARCHITLPIFHQEKK